MLCGKKQYRHIHFHIYAKPFDLPNEFWGAMNFAFINAAEAEAIPIEDIIAFCNKLQKSILDVI
jgi:hypothetical protein